MPSTVQVRVKNVNANAKQGSYDAVEITGYDATNSKGFKKKFFATKKDGSATKNAETAYTLNENDWCEITMDDTSYKNVQTIKKIAQPAGVTAPPANSGGGRKGGYNNPQKDASIARSVALKAAVDFVGGSDSADVETVIEHAKAFEAYLLDKDVNDPRPDSDPAEGSDDAVDDIPF
jgi:hypothetical protein